MNVAKRYVFSLFLIFMPNYLPAQNITGTWEGDLGGDQFLQLVIIQNGDKICGYTHDHVKENQKNFCKAYFEGTYDKQKNKLHIIGKSFIQNSGSHTLMDLNLNYKKVNDEDILEEKPGLLSVLSSFISSFTIVIGYQNALRDPFDPRDPVKEDEPVSLQYVHLKKVSDQPVEILDKMKDCFDLSTKTKDSVYENSFSEKLKDSLPQTAKINIPEKKADSLSTIITHVSINKDSSANPVGIDKRKNIEQSHIEVNVKTINLKVYDNAIVDGDTVSILYNGKLLLSHQLLSEKGIEINLELDEKQTRHEIILFAENLGSIPPNTALVVITAGKKRYELFASASLEENAVLVFDYRPEK